MAWFSKIRPIPSFPQYPGPYTVGSVDVEIPVSELDSPSSAPDSSIGTVAFRIFYPCEPTALERPIRWIPSPQRGYISAYARFMGANPTIASVMSFVPQLLYYISMPARRNGKLLSPDLSDRWPVIVFSHGLGGSRNAYSQLCGSIASYGSVVIATDHRDGSAPISYVRATTGTSANEIECKSYPHKAVPEVFDARDEQLKIRLWEMALIHEAIVKIDQGKTLKNLDSNSITFRRKDVNDVLTMFCNRLDVHTPGAIAWIGHSFGAATVLQLVKSVYYHLDKEKADDKSLFTPPSNSRIIQQITPHSPVVFLDMWCLPLTSPSTRWLWNKPLPCHSKSGPGGRVVLSILSEAFYNWREHLVETKKAFSTDPSSDSPPASKTPARLFYPTGSAHLSQSDFGILFPWMTKKIFKSQEPERTLLLNVRAILQHLRDSGWNIAKTTSIHMEDDSAQADAVKEAKRFNKENQDWKILHSNGGIRGWVHITTGPPKVDSAVASQIQVDGIICDDTVGDIVNDPGEVTHDDDSILLKAS